MPFFALGPTPKTNYSGETRLWMKMNNRLNAGLPEMGVPYCLLESMTDATGTSVLRGDGFHLNEAGHSYVAERLHQTMTPWVKQILENK